MKKRIAKKKMGNYLWNQSHNPNLCLPKISEIYEDCDGFNHIVSDMKLFHQQFQNGWVLYDASYIREDGHYFCGCMNLMLCPPRSPEEIRKYWKMDSYSQEYIDEQRNLGWWNEQSDRQLEFVKSGGIVCDEQGLPTKEWIALK